MGTKNGWLVLMPNNWLERSFSLEGRVALVTGATSGIGQAIATALAGAGADVAITSHLSSAETTESAIRSRGRGFTELRLDLAGMNTTGADELLALVEDELGPVNILVNNAGTISRSPAIDHSFDEWRRVMEVNLDAVWTLSQAYGRRTLSVDQRRASVINITSLLSFQGGVNVAAYAAAKHGVAGLTKALANEWAPRGINVNAIAPGYVETANTSALRDDTKRSSEILARIPIGRWGRPDDIAGAAVFLASPAAEYVHGHLLVVDGGWLAR